MRLQKYQFLIEIIPGKENTVAHALSRIHWPVQIGSESKSEDVCAIGEEDEEEFDEFEEQEEFEVDQVVEPLNTMEQMLLAQRDDRSMSTLKRWIEEQDSDQRSNSSEFTRNEILLPTSSQFAN